MLERLKAIYNQYEELRQRLELPETYSDPALYARVEREARELQPVAEAYAAYVRAGEDMNAALELQSDPEMRELAQEEFQIAKEQKERLEQQIRILLLPRDPNDQKNVIMEIRGGVGGEEGMLFAADLYRMYTLYAESKGWKIDVANVSETELGGIKEISFVVEGEGAWSRLKFEAGGHRVQRVPVTESGGRIHTSAATVAVLPEIEDVDFKLDLNDLKIDTYRSSGAGGQHVNKTESAIRITHLPTGVVVECQDERSQYKNKDRAMQILRSKLYEMEQAKQNAAVAAERKSQIGSGDRGLIEPLHHKVKRCHSRQFRVSEPQGERSERGHLIGEHVMRKVAGGLSLSGDIVLYAETGELGAHGKKVEIVPANLELNHLDAVHKSLGSASDRMLENLFRSPVFVDYPLVHEENAGAHVTGEAHLMGHDEHGEPLFRQLADYAQHLSNHGGVQGGCGLVEKDHLRVHGKGACDGYALLLPAGEGGRHVVRFLGHTDFLQKGEGLFFCRLLAEPEKPYRSIGHVLQHRHVLEKIETLEHHPHLHAQGVEPVSFRHDVLALEQDFTSGRRLEHVDCSQQGAFACAGRTDDAYDLARIDIAVHVFENGEGAPVRIAESLAQVSYAYQHNYFFLRRRFNVSLIIQARAKYNIVTSRSGMSAS